MIELEVTRVDDQAGGVRTATATPSDAVTDPNKLQLQPAELPSVPGADLVEVSPLVEIELPQFLLNQTERQRSAVHGGRERGNRYGSPPYDPRVRG